MPFSPIEIQKTNTATTRDWLHVSKDMVISAYDPTGVTSIPFLGDPTPSVPTPKADDTDAEPILGTHLRETVVTVKEWLGPRVVVLGGFAHRRCIGKAN